jgi:phenylalanyl-tRNA synthetase beta chain
MRISLNWLRQLVDFDLEPEALAESLTLAGFEVEDIEDRRTWADGVVVGKVLKRDPHPNADKLSVCQVDIGAEEPSTIVCGAPNVAAGLWVPVATVGAFLPKVGTEGLKIRPAKLRGVMSEGMICSLAELGLTKDSEGIHSFADAPTVGSDVRPLLGLDDTILDVTSTANRADALSMVGIAREVAALTGGKLHLPAVPDFQLGKAEQLQVQIEDPQACSVYVGTLIQGVKIAPSPIWFQRCLESAGIRPINNVVDITNYILLTWGQPLHAFDLDKLQGLETSKTKGLTLGIRMANAGETLTTLDSQARKLQTQNLLITANNQPIALAGVMGGESTEVSETTTNLLLEAAIFGSVAIRRSARAQGLRTEASTRYERGINPAALEIATHHALQLLKDLAGGQVIAQTAADHRQIQPRTLELRLERLQQVLGPVVLSDESDYAEVAPEVVTQTLTALGFSLKETAAGIWDVQVPPYRLRDIEREIDLIEEVARLCGYDKFGETLPNKTEFGYLSLEQSLTRQLREALRGAGLTELVHYSWLKPDAPAGQAVVHDTQQIAVVNPLLVEFSTLRSELVSGLLTAFKFNREQGNGPLNGFEIGKVFWNEEDGLCEADLVAGIMGGDPSRGRWVRHTQQDQPLTWYEAKGVLATVFNRLGVEVEYQPDSTSERLHPGRTASLWIHGERLGTFGQIHPQVCQDKDLPAEVYLFQMDWEILVNGMLQAQQDNTLFAAYSTFPAMERDLALFAATELSVAELERTIRKAATTPNGSLLETIELFDEYKGESVPTGERSLAFRLRYRTQDRTLTDAEVNPVHQKIRDALVDKFNVNLRS